MIETELNSMEALQRLVVAGFTDWKQFGEVYTKRLDDLILFNYTPAAQMAGVWTWLETVSRGLILNAQTGEVVARPFSKFWNWLEGGRLPAPGSTIRTITEKMDGSLGILYRHNGGYRIATRGSFESEQALWATEHLNSIYDLGDLPEEWTLLFEIIYPDNRIVVDYGHDEALCLLAIRNRHTGEYEPHDNVLHLAEHLEMPTPKVYSFEGMDVILKTTSHIDHEGYVVEFTDGSRFKIKGEKYRALHRIISHVSFNAVLDALLNDGYDAYRMHIPEEFWPEIDGYRDEIMQAIDPDHAAIMGAMTDQLIASFSTRKDMALWVQTQPRHLHRYFYRRYDGSYRREDLFNLIERRNVRTRVDRGEA